MAVSASSSGTREVAEATERIAVEGERVAAGGRRAPRARRGSTRRAVDGRAMDAGRLERGRGWPPPPPRRGREATRGQRAHEQIGAYSARHPGGPLVGVRGVVELPVREGKVGVRDRRRDSDGGVGRSPTRRSISSRSSSTGSPRQAADLDQASEHQDPILAVEVAGERAPRSPSAPSPSRRSTSPPRRRSSAAARAWRAGRGAAPRRVRLDRDRERRLRIALPARKRPRLTRARSDRHGEAVPLGESKAGLDDARPLVRPAEAPSAVPLVTSVSATSATRSARSAAASARSATSIARPGCSWKHVGPGELAEQRDEAGIRRRGRRTRPRRAPGRRGPARSGTA